MKIIDSYLRKWLPELKASPAKIVEALTLTGSMAHKIRRQRKVVYDIEVRQQRGDCWGYYGLAKELSVYFKTKLVLQSVKVPTGQNNLPITVKTKKVKRLIAYQISELKNTGSPTWLKKFLNLHEINSVNTLVDLTNFIMLWYGIPCHAFDASKVDKLIWEESRGKYATIVTLDGSKIKLQPENLLVTDGVKPVSLTFIGGRNSGVETATTETIVEMAIYDRVRVRRDWRGLKIQTESSVRLEKDLDPELIPLAIGHLVELILKNCGGQVTNKPFDYYPQPVKTPKIKVDLKKASEYAGIEIPAKTAKEILISLGCHFKDNRVIPPAIRKDLEIEEDVIEEIIRFYGYNRIPTNQPLVYKKLPDITPKILQKIKKIKTELTKQGYDEIRSWPLIQEKYLEKNGRQPVYTQNNINEKYPVLRNSIKCSLRRQKEQYNQLKVPQPKFFEVGKIFYKEDGQYKERYSLGTYNKGKYAELDLEADERG